MKYRNRIFQLLIGLYVVLLLAISSIACYFSYQQKEEELYSGLNLTFTQLEREYNDITDNFWQLYMPIFEGDSSLISVLSKYFSSDQELTPLERQKLSSCMHSILMRDNRVQWIALIPGSRENGCIIFSSGTTLRPLADDFPYLDRLQAKPGPMELFEMQTVSDGSSSYKTFAVCGNSPKYMGTGKLLAGYSLSSLEQICQNSTVSIDDLSWQLTFQDRILFSSTGNYTDSQNPQIPQAFRGRTSSGKDALYVRREICSNRYSQLSVQIPWQQLFLKFHHNTPMILGTVLLFILISVIIYLLMLHSIAKEVSVIRQGLDQISANHLDYRIPTAFHQGGLPEIAGSINQMSARLEENINRMYFYELKQKEAELAELQAKFNPHFLYNSLEMIRSRCLQNGDAETAEIISQLSAIFRGFIGSQTFVPLSEELMFSKRYLSLFRARYGDLVQVRFDIETSLLSFGIIRNLFQPLIENYFVHGFDAACGEENEICIRGRSLDEETMLLTVEDNGCGMSDEELARLNEKLMEPISVSTESYGLKNLQQRIRLFYGADYGMTIHHNEPRGLRIEMKVKKLSCEQNRNAVRQSS